MVGAADRLLQSRVPLGGPALDLWRRDGQQRYARRSFHALVSRSPDGCEHVAYDSRFGVRDGTSHHFADTQCARTNSTAPIASAMAPDVSCLFVAPTRITTHTASAATGTTGPPGIVNAARPPRRNANTAVAVPTYTTSRATALTVAIVANDLDNASVREKSDVRTMATTGV